MDCSDLRPYSPVQLTALIEAFSNQLLPLAKRSLRQQCSPICPWYRGMPILVLDSLFADAFTRFVVDHPHPEDQQEARAMHITADEGCSRRMGNECTFHYQISRISPHAFPWNNKCKGGRKSVNQVGQGKRLLMGILRMDKGIGICHILMSYLYENHIL